jgi:hypothetical protein
MMTLVLISLFSVVVIPYEQHLASTACRREDTNEQSLLLKKFNLQTLHKSPILGCPIAIPFHYIHGRDHENLILLNDTIIYEFGDLGSLCGNVIGISMLNLGWE